MGAFSFAVVVQEGKKQLSTRREGGSQVAAFVRTLAYPRVDEEEEDISPSPISDTEGGRAQV